MDRVFDIVNEETRAPAENPIGRVLREGVVVGLANHTALRSRDGRERPIADSGAPIRTTDGRVLGAVLVFRDQSAERASVHKLEREQERLRLFIEHTPAAVAVFDTEMRYLAWSRRFREDFRLPEGDPRGRSHYEIFPGLPERSVRSTAAVLRPGLQTPFVSGYAPERAQRALPPDRFVQKPFVPATLLERVRACLDQACDPLR